VGGVANGRTMAAALTLGAQGVMMATRFVATTECEVHNNIKQELTRRQEHETTLICKSIGLQGRAIKNKLAEEVLMLESQHAGLDKLIPLMSGKRVKEAWETGNIDIAPMMMGQSVGLVKDIPTCKELIQRMAAEAKAEIERVRKIF
jgi:nitronate monooxygenase